MPRTWIVLAIVYAAFFSWYTSFERSQGRPVNAKPPASPFEDILGNR